MAFNRKKYQVFHLPKRRGECRVIYSPSPEYSLELRTMLPALRDIYLGINAERVAHGFERWRNCASMAFEHIGWRFTLSMDVCDFFDSVTVGHVEKYVSKGYIDACFIDGKLPQGFPTSPILSNIAFNECDRKIVKLLDKTGLAVVYTRYADDLVFSFDDLRYVGKIKTIATQVLQAGGFRINERKTRLQDSCNGRVIITGIAVDKDGLHPTRKTLKKIRAAQHQQNSSSALGLTEWSRCKLPNSAKGW